MNNKIFIDTNVLVYAYDKTDEIKHNKAKNLLFSKMNEKDDFFISVQILNEFYYVLARKQVSHSSITYYINEIIENTKVLPILLENTMKAINLKKKYSFAWFDSVVLATSLQNGCKMIYSEDFQNNQVIEGILKIINPFTEL